MEALRNRFFTDESILTFKILKRRQVHKEVEETLGEHFLREKF